MAKVVFEEKQRMRQWWLVLLVVLFTGFGTFALAYQLITGEGLGNNPPSLFGMIFIAAFLWFLGGFFWRLELQTRIDEQGIHAKFWPFFGWRSWTWAELQAVSVRTYKPLLEYGGWGLRYGFQGWAYNIAGNKGIQLSFAGGKRLLVGTQKPEEAEAAIAHFQRKQHA